MNDQKLDIILDELKELREEVSWLKYNTQEEWLDVPGVAKFLRFSKSQIYKLVAAMKIPYYRVSGELRFNKKEISEWVKRGKVKTIRERADEILIDDGRVVRRQNQRGNTCAVLSRE